MKLFHWGNVATLANYNGGDVIVMAETKEQAIDLAVAELPNCRSKYDTEEDREFAEQFRNELERLPEPAVHEVAVALLFTGSE